MSEVSKKDKVGHDELVVREALVMSLEKSQHELIGSQAAYKTCERRLREWHEMVAKEYALEKGDALNVETGEITRKTPKAPQSDKVVNISDAKA